MNNPIIAPSILSADLGNLKEEIASLSKLGADWVHIDIMDGSFVPPITFGDNVVKVAKSCTKLFLDVHLMINKPENHIESFAKAGSDLITIHLEACPDPAAVLNLIRQHGIKSGLSLKPETDWQLALPYLELCDLILVMTVNPGWGGQAFMPKTLLKISALRAAIKERGLNTYLEVDGGINEQTASECLKAGANVLVAGSYIFGSKNRELALKSLRR